MKASQLNPICLVMKAVLHGMWESWGPEKREVGFPFYLWKPEPARHERVGVGVAPCSGLGETGVVRPPTSPVFASTVVLDKLSSPLQGRCEVGRLPL